MSNVKRADPANQETPAGEVKLDDPSSVMTSIKYGEDLEARTVDSSTIPEHSIANEKNEKAED